MREVSMGIFFTSFIVMWFTFALSPTVNSHYPLSETKRLQYNMLFGGVEDVEQPSRLYPATFDVVYSMEQGRLVISIFDEHGKLVNRMKASSTFQYITPWG